MTGTSRRAPDGSADGSRSRSATKGDIVSKSCSVCRRVKDEEESGLVVYRSPHVVLYHMPEVDLPGYLVLATVRHEESLGSLTDEEIVAMARVEQHAVKALLALPHVRKVYLASFGEVCAHPHFHLFPRTDEMLEAISSWTDGEIDGPRIFDTFRKALKTAGTPGPVFEIVQRLRGLFAEQSG